MRYTKDKVDAVANALNMAQLMADSYCREKVLRRRNIVSVIIIYDGDDDALAASLAAVKAQTWPCTEIFVVSLDEKKPAANIDGAKIFTEAPFERLAAEAKGEYAHWLMAGDVPAPEFLTELVLLLETHDKSSLAWALPTIETGNNAAKTNDAFAPQTIKMEKVTAETANFYHGNEFKKTLLKGNLYLPGNISSILFRRNSMNKTQWLKKYWMDKTPLVQTVWQETISSRGMLVFLTLPLIKVRAKSAYTADDFIFREMEWFYLLEKYRGDYVLPEDDYSAAVSLFKKNRETMRPLLQKNATPELLQAYEDL